MEKAFYVTSTTSTTSTSLRQILRCQRAWIRQRSDMFLGPPEIAFGAAGCHQQGKPRARGPFVPKSLLSKALKPEIIESTAGVNSNPFAYRHHKASRCLNFLAVPNLRQIHHATNMCVQQLRSGQARLARPARNCCYECSSTVNLATVKRCDETLRKSSH